MTYGDVLGTADPKGWHSYRLVWNKDGLNAKGDVLALYIDGVLRGSGLGASFVSNLQQSVFVGLGDAGNKSPFLIDEFKVWSVDKTTFNDPLVSDCTCVYDGKAHSVSVENDDGNVTYSLSAEGPFVAEKPTFKDVVTDAKVWYSIDGDVDFAKVTITPKPLASSMVRVVGSAVYNGSEQKPAISVSDGSPSVLTEDDWELVGYSNNVSAGTASVTIAAKAGGNYSGSAMASFSIAKATYDMGNACWSETRSFVYDGVPHGVTLTGLPDGVTATLSGNAGKDAGSYVASATLHYDSANYNAPSVGSCTWEITKRDLVLRVADRNKSYDGGALVVAASDVSGEGYVEGEALDYYDFTSLTEMGSGDASCSFRDSETAKAANYNVSVVTGMLRVAVGGSVYAGEVVSATMRPNDATVMDVKYIVRSLKDSVDVRMVVFKDGVRSLANVILPENFADGTEANVGDAAPANVTNTVSWCVSEDWNIDLAKVKVEILVKPNETLLPFDWVTIPGRGGQPTLKLSTNGVAKENLFNALLWLVADRDANLSLRDGELSAGGKALAAGAEVMAAGTEYVFGKMGYDVLAGEKLDYARAALRKPLAETPAYSRYAVKHIGE